MILRKEVQRSLNEVRGLLMIYGLGYRDYKRYGS